MLYRPRNVEPEPGPPNMWVIYWLGYATGAVSVLALVTIALPFLPHPY